MNQCDAHLSAKVRAFWLTFFYFQAKTQRPMKEALQLRPATLQDADLLLAWRNDPQTRAASHNSSEVAREDHLAWLSSSLANPNRRLFVAEEAGEAVGTVRADFSEGAWELSWTTAPQARGRGVAKRMVALLAQQIPDPIRAEVKVGNVASARIAQQAGMQFDREVDGVMHFKREGKG
jgi:RimJ/RimL family protein N-acetyltransferase